MHFLREIAEQSEAAASSRPGGGLTVHEIYCLLDVSKRRPQRNAHLVNPLNRDPNVFYFRPRAQPLSGDEPVYGQFLLLRYCSHSPSVILEDYDDLGSLESAMLSDDGVLNTFISLQFAFIDFRLAPYRITYRAKDGTVTLFSKQDQYNGKLSFGEEYRERKLEWSGP